MMTLLLTLALLQDEWTPLFNGKDLDGWVQRGGKADYKVEDGEIVGRSAPNTANSFLCTKKDYGDFVLELEFKVHPEMNSGVQIRSQHFEEAKAVEIAGKTFKIPAGRVHGYQVEIDPSARAFSGGIYDEGRRGWLADLKENEAARKAFKGGDWNTFKVECPAVTEKHLAFGVQHSLQGFTLFGAKEAEVSLSYLHGFKNKMSGYSPLGHHTDENGNNVAFAGYTEFEMTQNQLEISYGLKF